MKLRFIAPILLLLFISCKKELIDQLPANISKLKPVENLVDTLNLIFAENGNVIANNPFLFSDTIQKNIVLLKESEVFVTFIDEGTESKNTLCWYSYNKSSPPANTSAINGNVLFPNISKIGEGGLLELGYTVQLGTGKFPEGTVIGFFLIANGWSDGEIKYSNNTYYTNYNFNPDKKQHHVFFRNGYSHYLVMCFEDNINPPSDFNDVLFAVADNNEGFEATAFDLTKVVVR